MRGLIMRNFNDRIYCAPGLVPEQYATVLRQKGGFIWTTPLSRSRFRCHIVTRCHATQDIIPNSRTHAGLSLDPLPRSSCRSLRRSVRARGAVRFARTRRSSCVGSDYDIAVFIKQPGSLSDELARLAAISTDLLLGTGTVISAKPQMQTRGISLFYRNIKDSEPVLSPFS